MKPNNIVPMYPRPQRNKLLLWALFIIVILILASCSSSRKIKSSESLKVDQTSSSKSDSTGAKQVVVETIATRDSSGIKSSTETNSETITVNLVDDSWIKNIQRAQGWDTTGRLPLNDYEAAPRVFDITVNGHNIHSNQPIKNIVVENKNGRQVIDASQVKTKDSSSLKTTETAKVSKTDSSHISIDAKSKNKEVVRKRFGSWLWWLIIGGIVLVGWRLGWWRWLFAFLRKKKSPADKNDNSLTTIKYEPPAPPGDNNIIP